MFFTLFGFSKTGYGDHPEKLSPISLFLSSIIEGKDKINLIHEEYDALLQNLEKIDRSNERKFVKKMFQLTHRKSLKRYSNYVSIDQTLLDYKYDCVTGTALFASLLKDFDFSYRILEFEHHIVLLVNTVDGPILLESTDPISGVVVNSKEISERLEYYRVGYPTSNVKDGNEIKLVSLNKANNITIQELAGLQYFNLAVKSFNRQSYQEAYNYNAVAKTLYPESGRIQNFADLLAGLIGSEILSLND